jgi:P-type conjugative transfer protein TrbL
MKLSFLRLFCYLLIINFFLVVNAFAKDPDPNPNPESPPATVPTSDQSSASQSLFEEATYEYFEPNEGFEVFDENYLGESAVTSESDSEDNITIDSGAVTLIQSAFLGNISTAFSTVAGYALNLLYLFAVLELVIFGFVWALQRDVGWDKLFFKIIKIGLIFFIIQNYVWLLDAILGSFAQLAGVVINNTATAQHFFNPAKIWQYGYDVGVNLLQLATTNNNFGLILVQLSLGLGILLVFGLLGIQMVLQMVGFYMVSLGALILLPFGTFALSRGMFDKAVQVVLQAGIRLMTLMIIIGIAVVIWDGFQLIDLATTANFNINQPLGLFFTALLFLCLAIYLPNILSQAVGSFSSNFLDSSSSSPAAVHESGASSTIVTPGGVGGDMRAATEIGASSASMSVGHSGSGEVGGAAAATSTAPTVIAPSGGNIEAKRAKETLAQASNLSKSISESTVQKIKEAVVKAVKEK